MRKHTEAMKALVQRFNEKCDATNPLHKDLQKRLNDLSGQLNALRTFTADPVTAAQAAGRLRFIAEEADRAVGLQRTKAEASFDAALREHSGLKQGPFAVEIRQRVHEMKAPDKMRAIQDLIKAGDGPTLVAVP